MLFGVSWMIASMDLNASPQPEEDEDPFEPPFEEETAQEHKVGHVEHIESGVEIARRVFHFLLRCNLRI